MQNQKLRLSEKGVQPFGFKDYSENNFLNLKEQTNEFVNLQSLRKELDTQDSQKEILNIHLEVKKEGDVQKIDKNSQTKVSATQKRLKPIDRKNFKTALKKIHNFEKGTSTIVSRSRNAKSNSIQIQKLSLDEKKSIGEYLEEFRRLGEDKIQFSNELIRASRETNSADLVQEECLSCISNNLKTIGWINKELNLFDKRSRYVHHRLLTHGYYSNNRAPTKDQVKKVWGDWNSISHPYRSFFASEHEWFGHVNKIIDFWDGYYKYINGSGRIACSVLTLGIACSGGKEGLEKAIDDSKASLELKIASKLASLMNQLS